MDKQFDRHGRNPRPIDVAAIIALLAFGIAAYAVLNETWKKNTSPTAIGTTVQW